MHVSFDEIPAREHLRTRHAVKAVVDLHRGQARGVIVEALFGSQLRRIEDAFPRVEAEPTGAD